MDLLDLIFPKRCVSCGAFGKYICNRCFSKIEFVEKAICPICQRQAIAGKTHPRCTGKLSLDDLVVAAKYKGPIKLAIQNIKYKWIFDIEKILVDLLTAQIWKFDLPQNSILVPIPLSGKRKNWRGFNQAEILAKSLSRKFNHPFKNLLSRVIETETQVGLTREERKKNVMGAFALDKKVDRNQISGRNLILVDAVYTSGATMQEAVKVLKRADAKKVWAMAVALG